MSDKKFDLLPLEYWLKEKSKDQNSFPHCTSNQFERYQQIKGYCEREVYKWIGSGTSAEDQGIYTDHSIDHFNAVIKYAGKLVGVEDYEVREISLRPYEVFVMLVSILLHDAGNIFGRKEHEKRPLQIFKGMGKALCPDEFEARPIAKIAEVHGGKALDEKGGETKDTIRNSNLDEETGYQSISFRPRLVASLVRFADEICEDRSRAARFLIENDALPPKSEVYHHYANSISSVDVDLDSKCINIKYELDKMDVIKKKGKDGDYIYLIDEINSRLEKMFCELCYCKAFMYEVVTIVKIRATIIIYDGDDEASREVLELKEDGYPSNIFSVNDIYPEWCGEKVKDQFERKGAS